MRRRLQNTGAGRLEERTSPGIRGRRGRLRRLASRDLGHYRAVSRFKASSMGAGWVGGLQRARGRHLGPCAVRCQSGPPRAQEALSGAPPQPQEPGGPPSAEQPRRTIQARSSPGATGRPSVSGPGRPSGSGPGQVGHVAAELDALSRGPGAVMASGTRARGPPGGSRGQDQGPRTGPGAAAAGGTGPGGRWAKPVAGVTPFPGPSHGAGTSGRTGPGGAVRRAEPTSQGAGQESPQGVELGWWPTATSVAPPWTRSYPRPVRASAAPTGPLKRPVDHNRGQRTKGLRDFFWPSVEAVSRLPLWGSAPAPGARRATLGRTAETHDPGSLKPGCHREARRFQPGAAKRIRLRVTQQSVHGPGRATRGPAVGT
jgi:hypothetical protein